MVEARRAGAASASARTPQPAGSCRRAWSPRARSRRWKPMKRKHAPQAAACSPQRRAAAGGAVPRLLLSPTSWWSRAEDIDRAYAARARALERRRDDQGRRLRLPARPPRPGVGQAQARTRHAGRRDHRSRVRQRHAAPALLSDYTFAVRGPALRRPASCSTSAKPTPA